VEVTTALLPGTVATALTTESETADSLVLGSRGLGGFAGMVVGSVGHGVLHHVICPVAVVRPRRGDDHGPATP